MWMLLASPRDLGGCAALCVDALWAGELRLGGGEVGMMMVVWAHTCWETEEKNSAPHRAAGSSPRAQGRERTGGREDAGGNGSGGPGPVHCKAFMNERGPLYRGPLGHLRGERRHARAGPWDPASPTPSLVKITRRRSPWSTPRRSSRGRGCAAGQSPAHTLPPGRPSAHLSDATKSALAACSAAASARRFLDSSRIFFRAASNSSSLGFLRSSKTSLVDSSPAQPCVSAAAAPAVSPRPGRPVCASF